MNFKEQLKAQLLQVQKQTAEDITQDIAVIENKPLGMLVYMLVLHLFGL